MQRHRWGILMAVAVSVVVVVLLEIRAEAREVVVGTHEELRAAGGVYAEVYQSQLDPDELAVGEGAS